MSFDLHSHTVRRSPLQAMLEGPTPRSLQAPSNCWASRCLVGGRLQGGSSPQWFMARGDGRRASHVRDSGGARSAPSGSGFQRRRASPWTGRTQPRRHYSTAHPALLVPAGRPDSSGSSPCSPPGQPLLLGRGGGSPLRPGQPRGNLLERAQGLVQRLRMTARSGGPPPRPPAWNRLGLSPLTFWL